MSVFGLDRDLFHLFKSIIGRCELLIIVFLTQFHLLHENYELNKIQNLKRSVYHNALLAKI